jgi:hypothetical protein
MANSTFPANSWASGLTLVDPSQGLYQDSEGYYYQDSADGKTIYDLGTDSYIDYEGNPVGSSSSNKTGPWDVLNTAVKGYFGSPRTTIKTPTPYSTNTTTPSGIPPTATPSVMPYILGGFLAVGALAAYMYYKNKKK